MTTTASSSTGTIAQIFGPVVDVRFPAGSLPPIYSALGVSDKKAGIDVVLEVSQHLGNDVARCVAMSTTDGCRRGMSVENTGGPISVPVGERTKGRLFDLLGKPLDTLTKGELKTGESWPIHRPAPAFDQQEAISEIGRAHV